MGKIIGTAPGSISGSAGDTSQQQRYQDLCTYLWNWRRLRRRLNEGGHSPLLILPFCLLLFSFDSVFFIETPVHFFRLNFSSCSFLSLVRHEAESSELCDSEAENKPKKGPRL